MLTPRLRNWCRRRLRGRRSAARPDCRSAHACSSAPASSGMVRCGASLLAAGVAGVQTAEQVHLARGFELEQAQGVGCLDEIEGEGVAQRHLLGVIHIDALAGDGAVAVSASVNDGERNTAVWLSRCVVCASPPSPAGWAATSATCRIQGTSMCSSIRRRALPQNSAAHPRPRRTRPDARQGTGRPHARRGRASRWHRPARGEPGSPRYSGRGPWRALTSPRPATARPPSPRTVAGWTRAQSLTKADQIQVKAVVVVGLVRSVKRRPAGHEASFRGRPVLGRASSSRRLGARRCVVGGRAYAVCAVTAVR